MSDGEFLSGRALSDRIRAICAEDEVDCAVAFWGGSVRDDLFPRWKKQKVRIVCDISMGCNSQKSLIQYGAPDNKNLTVLDGLHAKVFVSRAGAIVGSANASANGVGTTKRQAANLEAGIFFVHGSDGWHSARRFVDQCLKNEAALPLNQTQLNRAPLHARDAGPHIGPAGPNAKSVLDLVMSYPGAFSDTLIFSEDEDIDPDDLHRLKREYDKEKGTKSFKPADRVLIIVLSETDIPFKTPNVLLYWLVRIVSYSVILMLFTSRTAKMWLCLARETGQGFGRAVASRVRRLDRHLRTIRIVCSILRTDAG